jgi:hypothetical protein
MTLTKLEAGSDTQGAGFFLFFWNNFALGVLAGVFNTIQKTNQEILK